MRHAPNSNSLAHPVVLTTVHGAKGLEYPMVVLPFLQRKPKSDGDFVVGADELGAQSEHCLMGAKLADPKHGFERKLTTLGATLASGLKERDTAEERRVFYVACTRAQDYLVLGMPLPSNFATEQKKYEDYDQIERKQQLRANSNPIRWLRLLGRVDDLKSPSKWQFETPAGSPLEVPII
jgi:ATP-dependent exoDNAse (exonuclease V) beta subunit